MSNILPLPDLAQFFKLQFMQQFSQNFLPLSFNETWMTNAIRMQGQAQIELRNANDIHIPFARLSSTMQHPLTCFPRLWHDFEDDQIKFIRNRLEFNKKLKLHFLNKLSPVPVCNRLFCPNCLNV